MIQNKPYKKEYDNEGKLLNPITKDQPYLFTSIEKKYSRRFRMWQKNRNKFFTGKTIIKG